MGGIPGIKLSNVRPVYDLPGYNHIRKWLRPDLNELLQLLLTLVRHDTDVVNVSLKQIADYFNCHEPLARAKLRALSHTGMIHWTLDGVQGSNYRLTLEYPPDKYRTPRTVGKKANRKNDFVL